MSAILKVSTEEPDEDAELQHELDYQDLLTTTERFAMMFQKSHEMARELLKRGYRQPVEIIKRS
jgi:hypothetical protein